tara:strand:- start:1304 stop:1444 length:141 start_codon:yes stop_codon:yes gene_type:complete
MKILFPQLKSFITKLIKKDNSDVIQGVKRSVHHRRDLDSLGEYLEI